MDMIILGTVVVGEIIGWGGIALLNRGKFSLGWSLTSIGLATAGTGMVVILF